MNNKLSRYVPVIRESLLIHYQSIMNLLLTSNPHQSTHELIAGGVRATELHANESDDIAIRTEQKIQ